jgi:RimJ/RimL family protein N-acetyltransferase
LTTVPTWWVLEVLVDGEVVGDAGFHGPPAAAGPVEVEIGYAVVPERRGRGIATAACGELLALAWRQGADTVLAETEPDNLASRRVLLGNGFRARADGTFAIGRLA